MAVFNKGDMVVRKDEYKGGLWADEVMNPHEPYFVEWCNRFTTRLVGLRDVWDTDKFDLYVEPQPEPVTVTEPSVQQIPGVPDGYQLVRIGAPKKGEQYLDLNGGISNADCDWWKTNIPVIEPIVPPAPPTPIPTTVKVQLNRYLVGDLKNGKVCVCTCTAEYAEFNMSSYRLLGPSETLELEVEV